MFQGELQKRLELLDGNLVCVSDSQIHLIEKREQGALRFQMHEKEERTCPKDCQDWNGKGAILNFLGKDKFKYNKIPLNAEDGTGSYNLCEGRKR